METNLPWTAQSLDSLVHGVTERVPVRSSDAKSGASFERLIIDGRPCFLKLLSAQDDWLMRVTGNTTNWEFQVWQAGLYHSVPSVIDHAMIGMALDNSGSHRQPLRLNLPVRTCHRPFESLSRAGRCSRSEMLPCSS